MVRLDNVVARRVILSLVNHRQGVRIYDDMKPTTAVYPLEDESTLSFETDLEGTSMATRIAVSLRKDFDRCVFEVRILKKVYRHVLENSLGLSPFQLVIQAKIFDAAQNELEYPLLVTIVPQNADGKTGWMDISENIESCQCEIRCAEILFDYENARYRLVSHCGIDQDMKARDSPGFGFRLFGDTTTSVYLWSDISTAA
ncbi:hypothetical protein EBZ80_04870 [bacterium]|nr:hypothetical protein [bacterium]